MTWFECLNIVENNICSYSSHAVLSFKKKVTNQIYELIGVWSDLVNF